MDPLALSDELDEASFKTNLLGAHFVTKHALPLLFASPAKLQRTVVMVSSSAGEYETKRAWRWQPLPCHHSAASRCRCVVVSPSMDCRLPHRA